MPNSIIISGDESEMQTLIQMSLSPIANNEDFGEDLSEQFVLARECKFRDLNATAKFISMHHFISRVDFRLSHFLKKKKSLQSTLITNGTTHTHFPFAK